ncbi:sulfurtransferase TusA family protein [Sporosarcina sp. 179-K 3D1 HS]|uniref:sulfurtransferase TusA family protein n=1 Tax=Sporosarcina sp. 179-K 3D1 HS TaxID=3232169 RepID=UPI0039A200D0
MIQSNAVLDAKGLACPMPIVKTRKAVKGMEPGEVIEVQATDKGSIADLKAWAESSGHHYLGTIEEDGHLKHYIRKSSEEEKMEQRHPHTVSNEELQAILKNNNRPVILDVRESVEYAFSHIPGALSIPLGDLETASLKLPKEETLYVVCRTGNRSDLAAQKLTEAGFTDVKNVLPGMTAWSGPIEKSIQ